MKHLLVLQFVCLIAVAVYAAPPFGIPEENLAPHCRTPKCPLAQDGSVQSVNLTYPLDCLLYIDCEHEARIESCPGNQVFNKKTGLCDNPEKANCVPCWQETA